MIGRDECGFSAYKMPWSKVLPRKKGVEYQSVRRAYLRRPSGHRPVMILIAGGTISDKSFESCAQRLPYEGNHSVVRCKKSPDSK